MRKPMTWWLEMRDPARLRPRRSHRPGLRLMEVEIAAPAFARFLYEEVGRGHEWTDRLEWREAEWRAWLERGDVEFWLLSERGAPAGYFQIEGGPEGDAEIAYLGLLADHRGRGLGAHLVTAAAERAWAAATTRRVWLHTCSLDSPHARANYEARGFQLYRSS